MLITKFDCTMLIKRSKPPKNGEIREILRRPEGKKKKQVKTLAGGQIGWGVGLAGRLDWLEGQIGL